MRWIRSWACFMAEGDQFSSANTALSAHVRLRPTPAHPMASSATRHRGSVVNLRISFSRSAPCTAPFTCTSSFGLSAPLASSLAFRPSCTVLWCAQMMSLPVLVSGSNRLSLISSKKASSSQSATPATFATAISLNKRIASGVGTGSPPCLACSAKSFTTAFCAANLRSSAGLTSMNTFDLVTFGSWSSTSFLSFRTMTASNSCFTSASCSAFTPLNC
mmetsp:Transcript_48753/g.137200  ORF Transcript_48753/g.137200 Transcript_48753/m.137200 type:complete len:218 (+) Transcript_48753:2895-3548(+)